MTYNFNLTFERELLTGLMARRGYVGTRNRNGRQTITLNYAEIIAGATRRHRCAPHLRLRRTSAQIESQVQDRRSNYNSMQLAVDQAVLARLHDYQQLHAVEGRRRLR